MQRHLLTITITVFISIVSKSYAQIPPFIPSNGLVGYWGFNANTNDESGNNNHGTPTNVTLTTDRFGNSNSAYLFNGSTSKIQVNTDFLM
jgi:hypothetical protein